MDYLEHARDFFSKDKFATQVVGIVIDAADIGFSKCSMKIEDRHLNAAGTIMGGAIFTLADLAFGVAANVGQPHTVTLTSSITYLGVCKGETLIARAICEKAGQSTCTYTIHVDDDLGNKVAIVSVTGFIIGR